MGIWLAGCPCSVNEDFLVGLVSRPRVVLFPAAWPWNTCPLWRTSASCLVARCTLGMVGGVELGLCREAVQHSLPNNRQDEELHLSCVLGAFI